MQEVPPEETGECMRPALVKESERKISQCGTNDLVSQKQAEVNV